MRGRLLVLPLILALAGFYGYRAVSGAIAAYTMEMGHFSYNDGDNRDALAYLESAAVGSNRMRALEMAGGAYLDIWDVRSDRQGPLAADATVLQRAAELYLECRCIAPASRTARSGLGFVYDELEWIARHRRATAPWVAVEDPWERVGRSGRIGLGLTRLALERGPTWFELHDQLAMTLWSYGLDDEARMAVRRSAEALPLYIRHTYVRVEELPGWVAAEFAEASRAALGEVPLISATLHTLDLGKLERRIGENERAVSALRQSLEGRGDSMNRAEANFHLGLALIDLGQVEEGRQRLEKAAEHPVFRIGALRGLAELAQAQGDDAAALEHLRQLRWQQPREIWPALEFAEVAARLEDWPAVQEALMWAKLIHAEDVRPYEALVEAYIAMGDFGAARGVVQELSEIPETELLAERLRRSIAIAARSGG